MFSGESKTPVTNPTSVDNILYRTFRPGDEAAFARLNEAWITKYFAPEPDDYAVLNDPKTHILDPGGQICIAELRGETIGCCALIVIEAGVLELAKMTVSESVRGNGVGRKLLQFAIDEARRMGAHRLCLESNTKAAAAIHLYEQLGFRHLSAPAHQPKHARANVFMELPLDI
jgi:N-acetylglutamate synthase-like GNAT family acetyltransferase